MLALFEKALSYNDDLYCIIAELCDDTFESCTCVLLPDNLHTFQNGFDLLLCSLLCNRILAIYRLFATIFVNNKLLLQTSLENAAQSVAARGLPSSDLRTDQMPFNPFNTIRA